YDLAEDFEPPVFGKITEEFIRRATESFMQAGAYIQTADAEGVVALFGFPEIDAHHGDKAVRVALNVVEQFRQSQLANGEARSDGPRRIRNFKRRADRTRKKTHRYSYISAASSRWR